MKNKLIEESEKRVDESIEKIIILDKRLDGIFEELGEIL